MESKKFGSELLSDIKGLPDDVKVLKRAIALYAAHSLALKVEIAVLEIRLRHLERAGDD